MKPTGNLRKTPDCKGYAKEPQEGDPLGDLLDGIGDIDLDALFDDQDLDALLAELAAFDLDALLAEWGSQDLNALLGDWGIGDLPDWTLNTLPDWTFDDLPDWSLDDLVPCWTGQELGDILDGLKCIS